MGNRDSRAQVAIYDPRVSLSILSPSPRLQCAGRARNETVPIGQCVGCVRAWRRRCRATQPDAARAMALVARVRACACAPPTVDPRAAPFPAPAQPTRSGHVVYACVTAGGGVNVTEELFTATGCTGAGVALTRAAPRGDW